MKLWGVLAFALIGATATTLANRWLQIEGAQFFHSLEAPAADAPPRPSMISPQTKAHHHRSRKTPYTVAEIKRIMYLMRALLCLRTAFRAKAMEFHPDQNQSNKEAAEFKKVLKSYEAIKKERKNM